MLVFGVLPVLVLRCVRSRACLHWAHEFCLLFMDEFLMSFQIGLFREALIAQIVSVYRMMALILLHVFGGTGSPEFELLC